MQTFLLVMAESTLISVHDETVTVDLVSMDFHLLHNTMDNAGYNRQIFFTTVTGMLV